MKYYFFSLGNVLENSANVSEPHHHHLINVYSIQKIFFDFDQCQERPVLSKSIEVDEI
jgi:hypothetical protein